MYVVTFYSFKGGVGRSMALMNVGVKLAQQGKRVLLVDFDLEAPGLGTFSVAPSPARKGIVDFVSEYLETGVAPDVSEYVSEKKSFADDGGIWLMSVGQQDAAYSRRLNSLNWQELYEQRSGYLLFEDLRKQWETKLRPDYVLIDSRTGHSDVEGICTRQLPNAVCLVFFPNEQNLRGLKRIVSTIRAHNAKLPRRVVSLNFAVSNVPDLDDEDQILRSTLQRFKTELGYERLASEIHHYNALSLLNQEVFALSRPNSRLSQEYADLTRAITRGNMGDRVAALDFLREAKREFGEEELSLSELNEKIQVIQKNFPQDGEVSFRIAVLLEQMGNVSSAYELLAGPHVAATFKSAAMFSLRAQLASKLGLQNEARDDLHSMLDATGADLETFLQAMSDIDKLCPEIYEDIPSSAAFNSLSVNDQVFASFQFDGGRAQIRAKASVLRNLLQSGANSSTFHIELVRHELALALIAVQEFKEAVELLSHVDTEESKDISGLFNLAMAKWGAEGIPDIRLVRRVADVHDSLRNANDDANYAQCMSIVFGLLEQTSIAKDWLSLARARSERARAGMEFSAWTFTRVNTKSFSEHLSELEAFVVSLGKDNLPRFLKPGEEQIQLLN